MILLPIDKYGNLNFAPSEINGFTLFANGVKGIIGRTHQMPTIELSAIYQGLQDHRLRVQAGYRYEEIKVKPLISEGSKLRLPFLSMGNTV